jgi:hypothetical protein
LVGTDKAYYGTPVAKEGPQRFRRAPVLKSVRIQ